MLSLRHAVLVELLRRHPGLIPNLLRLQLKVPVPRGCHVTVGEACLDQLAPTEFRADLMLELRRSPEAKPWMLVIVEVQLRVDHDKCYSWPSYVANLRASRRLPVCLVVVTPSAAVAAWASSPIDLGPGNEKFRVHVLGPEQIPVLTNPAAVTENPSFAALSLLANGPSSNLEVVVETLTCLADVDKEDTLAYAHLILEAIGAPLRHAVKAYFAMLSQQIPEAKLLSFFKVFVDRGKAEGRAAGEAAGRAAGEAEGRAAGEAAGRASALLCVLETRGIALSAGQRVQVESCSDLRLLDLWLRRALSITTADELFAAPPRRRGKAEVSSRRGPGRESLPSSKT